MAFSLSRKSQERMRGVHPDLVRVVELAIKKTKWDFGITCGTRTLEQQKQLLLEGKSKTLNSKHLIQPDGYGHAIDFVVYKKKGETTWEGRYYKEVAQAFMDAASELGVPIKWGGSFSGFYDGPHIQLEK